MILKHLLILLIALTINTVSLGQHFVSHKEIKAHNNWITLKKCQSKLLNIELAYRLAIDRCYLISGDMADDIVDSDTLILVYSYENNNYNELLAGNEAVFEYSRQTINGRVLLDTTITPDNHLIFNKIYQYLHKNKPMDISEDLLTSHNIHAIVVILIQSGDETDDGLDKSRWFHFVF
jgi:hypothetical protein